MKKIFYLLFMPALVLSACSDNDDKDNNGTGDVKIRAKASEVTGLPDGVAKVHFKISAKTAAVAQWDNGFELELPATVEGSQLTSIEEADYYHAEATISNAKTKVTPGTWIKLHDSGDNLLADLAYGSDESKKNVWVDWVYSDSDCNITGTIEEEIDQDGDGVPDGMSDYTYSVSLKKGWNQVALILEYKEDGGVSRKFTTSIPSGLKWYCYND